MNSFLISCSCSVQEPQVCYRLSESVLLKLNPILEEQLHLWTLGHGFLQRASGLAPTLHLLPGLLPLSCPPIHFPVLPPKQSCSFVHLITSFQISHSPCGPACSIYLLIDFALLFCLSSELQPLHSSWLRTCSSSCSVHSSPFHSFLSSQTSATCGSWTLEMWLLRLRN